MASPTQMPPRYRRRSLAGPVILILIGVVALLSTSHVVSEKTLLFWFGQYWPGLIILWGVIKLIEYRQDQAQGLRPRGIGAGGVFLLIFLIMTGVTATQATKHWTEITDNFDWDESGWNPFGESYSYDDQITAEFPLDANVHVVNDRGAVNITTSDDAQMHVTVRKRVFAENKENADKWNAGTKPQINTSGNTVTVNANTHGAGDHRIATDLDIAVPRKASVTVSSRNGDVSVSTRDGDADISCQHGDITLQEINGKVNINLDHGSAKAANIAGELMAQGRGDDISVEDAKRSVRISGEFDNVRLARIAGQVSFKSARTDMELASLTGDLDMDSGDLRASGVAGPLRLVTRSKDIRLTGISGDVRLENQNGAVELHFARLGSVQLSNRNSEVQVYLPEKATFQLDARARGAEVESDFTELKIQNNDDQGVGTGSVGSGGPHIVISNEHGPIEIRRSSAVAETPAPPKPPKPPSHNQPEETDN